MLQQKKRMGWLANVIRSYGYKTMVELGVRKGDTYLFLLKQFPNLTITGVDIWAPIPYRDYKNLGTWPHLENEKFVRVNAAKFGKRARLLKTTTNRASAFFKDGSVDLVFIDADHETPAVRQDILNWRPKIRSGGMLCGHDIHWPSVKKAVDELVEEYFVGPDNVWYTLV